MKAVLVTGASTGIGRATALALDAHGFRVFAGVRRERDGDALREAAPRLEPIRQAFLGAGRLPLCEKCDGIVKTATISFVGDSAIAVVTTPGNTATRRFATKAGAIPYLNPSVVLIGVVIERSRRANLVEIPVFAVGGGVTLTATVSALGADSVSVKMSGGEMRLAVDATGRVTGGNMGNNVMVELTSGPVNLVAEKPDYSVPTGAPYTAEEVTVKTPAGHVLTGTLTLPKGDRKSVV